MEVKYKKNTTKIQDQVLMMPVPKKSKTQQELMQLAMRKEQLNSVIVIKQKTCQAQECIKKWILMMVKLSLLEGKYKKNTTKILAQGHMMLVMRELKIQPELMPLGMRKEQPSLVTVIKMMIYQVPECIKKLILTMVNHLLLEEKCKKSIIKTQVQEHMTPAMRGLKIRPELMPLVMKREQRSLATIIKMMIYLALECTKKLTLMMVKLLLLEEKYKKNIIKIQAQEPMMLAIKM